MVKLRNGEYRACALALAACALWTLSSPVLAQTRSVWLGGPEHSSGQLTYSLRLDDAREVLAIEVEILFPEWSPDTVTVTQTALLQGFYVTSNVLDNSVLIAAAGAQTSALSGLIGSLGGLIGTQDTQTLALVSVPNPGYEPKVGLARVSLNGGQLPVTFDRIAASLQPGDFDGDDRVDFDDFFRFADHFGLSSSDPEYDPLYDLDGNGTVDFDDFFIFADHFGTTY